MKGICVELPLGIRQRYSEIRDTLCQLDISRGESSHQSGWCEQAFPSRPTERPGRGVISGSSAAELGEAEGEGS